MNQLAIPKTATYYAAKARESLRKAIKKLRSARSNILKLPARAAKLLNSAQGSVLTAIKQLINPKSPVFANEIYKLSLANQILSTVGNGIGKTHVLTLINLINSAQSELEEVTGML